ncbi:MAG: 1-deoxy-D-xylulose-5-phosphate reductoisomerase [Deltaproteobacteria bacterium]
MAKKNIAILGSSGSIGAAALDVVRRHKDRLRVVGLSVRCNTQALLRQAEEFRPRTVVVGCDADAQDVARKVRRWGGRVLRGREGLCRLAQDGGAETVLIAIVGSEAFFPLRAALKARKTVALANKESIVMGAELLMGEARRCGARILPIDSEQSAIFQCLEGRKAGDVERIYLTASGGPLYGLPRARLRNAPRRLVLAHPRWKMGPKITVDSATMMNKGLEVIEARHLFGLPIDKIAVVIHRQAIVHSMVAFRDGCVLAQMGVTDMRLPIQYALSYPERWPESRLRLDVAGCGALTFEEPDTRRFPCLGLAYEAARRGGCLPAVMNAANEEAVATYLKGAIAFGDIPRVIERVTARPWPKKAGDFDAILEADAEARACARALMQRGRKT